MADEEASGSRVCVVCGGPGWDTWNDANSARTLRMAELREMSAGPAPVLMIRRCRDALYHVGAPVAVVKAAPRRLAWLPARPWEPVPSDRSPEYATYIEAVRAAVLDELLRQKPDKEWPPNRSVASRYSIRKSAARELRDWLLTQQVIRCEGERYVTQAPSGVHPADSEGDR